MSDKKNALEPVEGLKQVGPDRWQLRKQITDPTAKSIMGSIKKETFNASSLEEAETKARQILSNLELEIKAAKRGQRLVSQVENEAFNEAMVEI